MKNQIEVKMIEDSLCGNGYGPRLITLQLKYHRYIHSEFMTHRVFSRSASSSRAVPIKKIIKQVWDDPAMPVHWGANISGMQAKTELTGWKLRQAKLIWKLSSKVACVLALALDNIGLHKQISNRILEPFSFINVIVTATEFDNFFELRIHPDAQPEIHELAKLMKSCIDNSVPRKISNYNFGREQDYWHLPYISETERKTYSLEVLLRCSVARCARVSFNNHDGTSPSITKDIELHDILVGSVPLHASPAEHQATPASSLHSFHKNFRGWNQYRTELEENF